MTDGEIRWWSQPFPPEGGGTAEGIKKALGRPSLPEFAILVREAAQNSWDARAEERISFKITLRRLGSDAVKWRQLIGSTSTSAEARGNIAKLSSTSWVLTVSDRGTSGLGGPLRSDEKQVAGQDADFVQFMRNFGEPRDTKLGGGTYGFGKGIFYRVSVAGAILVDTLNRDGDQNSRRLMGAALGGTEVGPDGRRLTGRHWWGQINGDVPDPIIGDQAASIADALGLPGFADGRTGTDVTVILPNLQFDDVDNDPMKLASRLRAHLYWYLWPKMVEHKAGVGIDFAIEVDGVDLEFPPLSELPVFSDLQASLQSVWAGDGTAFTMPTHQRKYGFLGHLSIQPTMPGMFVGPQPVWESILEATPIEQTFRHIARMRKTELVVDYFEGEASPIAQIGYVGSFVTSESVDEYFALAEPPTHDTWETAALVGAAKGIVQRSKKFLHDECSAHVAITGGTRSKAVQGLGKLSSSLGAVVANATGTRPTPESKPARGSETGKGARRVVKPFEITQESRVVVHAGVPYVETDVTVSDDPAPACLVAEVLVILASGRKENPKDAPVGAASGEFLFWYFGDDPVERVASSRLDLPRAGKWTARAKFVSDVSVRVVVSERGA